MNPRVRFAVTMSFLVMVIWLWGIANDYLFGEVGLNVGLFIRGIFMVGFAALFGFVLVALGVFFVTQRKKTKSAFEADTIDEYGTTFNWPIMLSKFVPEIIAPPVNAPITPLEQELIGFLNGYRTWPQDIKQPEGESLAATAMRRWHAVRKMHNTSELHRIVALSLDLGKVLSYAEKRESAPLGKPWRQDKVKYVQKAAEHGGFSAFVLSTFDTFRRLDEDTRQTLLLAVRFGRDPQRIPTNAPKLVREIYTLVHRADASLHTDKAIATPEALSLLGREVRTYAQGILAQLPVTNEGAENAQGVFVGGQDGLLVVSLSGFMAALAVYLPPEVRQQLDLWEVKRLRPEVQQVVVEKLREMGLLVDTYEQEAASEGVFSFSFAGKSWPQCLVLRCTPDKAPLVLKRLGMLPAATSLPEPAVDDEALLADIKAKALSVDGLLQG